MDYALVLDHHYDRIIADLDVYEIEDYIKELEEENLLQPQDVKSILNKDEDNTKRAEKLLDILRTRLQSKIKTFIDHFKRPYHHLFEDFDKDLKRIKNIDNLPTTKNHIRRMAALEKIQKHLKNCATFVIISGFPGTGKTNLAVEAAMLLALKHSVYWVNAGGSAGNQLKVLRMLLSRLKPMQENPDSQSDPEELARLLKELLKEDDVVILDNVSTKVDLRIFRSLPPKFIITTTDSAIMENFDSYEKIDMNKGFSKDESLELIAKVVQKDVHSLPSYVANVHKYFQGYPLAVTLIAGQLAHCNENHWAEYCQFSDDIDTSTDGVRVSIDSTIEKCIKSLIPEYQDYYKKLAIFKDNVFLTTETLQVLWDCRNNMNMRKVYPILTELEKKNMIIKVSRETSVYEIHSLLLNYLRRQHSEEDIKRLHESFVNNYLKRYKNIADITDDHYIFYYIIYHIISADCLEKFRSELFNLDYIMAKLVACGPNDMAEDLKLYKDAFERSKFDKRRMDEIAEFSEKFGWDIYHTKVKDVQFFLHMSENSMLFKEAMTRCQEKKLLVLVSKWRTQRVTNKDYPFQSVVTKLFFLEKNKILCEKWADSKPTIVSVQLGDVKETVIAKGSILCICVNSGNLLYKNHEKENRVFLKQVCQRTPDLTRQTNGDKSYFQSIDLPSDGKEILKLQAVSIAAFTQTGDKVVFASNSDKGVYCIAEDEVKLIPKTRDSSPVPSPDFCCFCWIHNSEILMFASKAREIYFYETSRLALIQKYEHPTKILDMTPIPNKMQLLVISDKSAMILSWPHGPRTSWQELTIGGISQNEILPKSCIKQVKCLKCYATSRWIAIATPDGCVVKGNANGKEFFKVGYGEVAAFDIEDNSLTMVSRKVPRNFPEICNEISGGLEENRRITVYNLLEIERQPRPYLTDACHYWPIQKGYLLGIVEPGNVAFYNDQLKIFETNIADPISIDMSLMGDIAVVGDTEKAVHLILPFKKKKSKLTVLGEAADFLRIDPSGKFIVAGSTQPGKYTFCVGNSSKENIMKEGAKIPTFKHVDSPIFECFFDEDDKKGLNIVMVFKNGLHLVYETATNEVLNEKSEQYRGTNEAALSCTAYQKHMLIKGIGTSLHVFDLENPDYHLSADFQHRITSCCIAPYESPHSQQSAGDSSKPRLAVALATNDHRFEIVICCKFLNEKHRFTLDYAKEDVQQMVFSKSQTILMARCDWLCFWDVNDNPKSSSAKASRSTLHRAWKTDIVPLDTEQKLLTRFKLQPEVLSLLPSEDFGGFAVVHKKGDRRILQVVDYHELSKERRIYSDHPLHLNLNPQNGSL